MLIGTALILSGTAMRRRSGLGLGWAIPSVVLGGALIVLNAATFLWPPGDRGLVDIGPFIGVFVMALAARLAIFGKRCKYRTTLLTCDPRRGLAQNLPASSAAPGHAAQVPASSRGSFLARHVQSPVDCLPARWEVSVACWTTVQSACPLRLAMVASCPRSATPRRPTTGEVTSPGK